MQVLHKKYFKSNLYFLMNAWNSNLVVAFTFIFKTNLRNSGEIFVCFSMTEKTLLYSLESDTLFFVKV